MLQTKLQIPSQAKNLVHRSILYDRLNKGLRRKLILISAPAGFGKTTLISDWVRENKITTVWFSIGSSDDDPVVFLSYIISGIQKLDKEFGHSALKLLKSPKQPDPESIVNFLINDIININKDFLLVLDDFHLINNIEISSLVSYLLEYIPENIHVVISSRSDPNLPLSKLRSQHNLVELRSADLSFSINEISDLFIKKFKFNLSVEDINSLETKTEGWIAGLQLAALSMQGQEDSSAFIKAFAGNNRYIMDYLIEEVLKIQSDEIKDFLLQTSILEQISAPLCNTVLSKNNSQIILEELEKNNMFVFPLDSERHWYRYHHLFADLLKQRLLQKEQSTIETLHNKSSEWFEKNGMVDLAIEHALEIKNYERSLLLLGEIVERMWENGQHSAILKYGDMIPDEIIKKNPEFCLYYAWILIVAGNIQKSEPFLASAESITKKRILEKNTSEDTLKYHKTSLGKIAVAFAYMNSMIGRPDIILTHCKTAMENLSEDDPLWYSWAWFSNGIAKLVLENYEESIKDLNKALEYGKKSGNIYLMSTIVIRLSFIKHRLGHYKSAYKLCTDLLFFMKERGYSQIAKMDWTYAGLFSNMAMMQYMWADLDGALENIETAYHLCKAESNVLVKYVVHFGYSMVLQGRGDMDGSVEQLNEIDDLLREHRISPQQKSTYIAWKGYILICLKQYDRAYGFLKENGLSLEKELSYTDEHGYMAYAHLLLTELKIGEAEILLSKLLKLAIAGKRIERLHELKIFYAILHKINGNRREAVKCIIESMEYAAPNDILMYFILYLDRIDDLLNDVYKTLAISNNKIPNGFIDKLKLAIEKRERWIKNRQELELSARERELLQLITEDLSNQEIADKLFISLNTVKTHLKNIYLKLEVENRSKASAKIKELGLV